MNEILSWLSQQNQWVEIITILFFSFAAYYIGAFFLNRLIKRAVRANARARKLHKKDIEKRQRTLAALFSTIWRAIMITLGTFMILRVFFDSLTLAPLFASAGIVGVALGFGSQALVKDFLSGMFIITENQYRIGDTIMINNNNGIVERISARSTVIRDDDGNVHYFPNGTITHVINKTMGYSVARFSITVKLSNKLDDVIEIVDKIGKDMAESKEWKNKIITPPAFDSIGDVTATTVDLLIVGKTQPSDQWKVTADMRYKLLVEFEKKEIAFGK